MEQFPKTENKRQNAVELNSNSMFLYYWDVTMEQRLLVPQ
jgi:hypothetical protein